MDEVVGFVKVAAMRELLAICRANPGLTRWDADIAHPFSWRAVPLVNARTLGFEPAPGFGASDHLGEWTGLSAITFGLDGKPVGTGKPGPVWRRIYEQWQHYKRELAGQPW